MNVKTNQFGGALLFILGEFAAAEEEMIEDGGMEVFGEDDQGREGSCEVSINELAQAASDEIKHLTAQLAKANERVKEIEGQLQLTMLTTHEASFESDYGKKRLSKFAIDKKIDGVQLVIDALASKGMLDTLISFVINSVVEQLRKEQDHG